MVISLESNKSPLTHPKLSMGFLDDLTPTDTKVTTFVVFQHGLHNRILKGGW